MDPLIWQLILQLVLILINAFFASAEIAVVSLNASKLKADAEEGDKRAAKLLRLLEAPTAFLSTIQIAITLAGLLGSAFAATNFADRLTNFLVLDRGFTAIPAQSLNALIVILITLVLGYFTLVLGELVPKRIAMQKPMQIARVAAPVVSTLAVLMRPVIWFLSISVTGVLRLFGLKNQARSDIVTEEDIRMMLDESEEEGLIESAEGEMIDNVFEFNNIQIYDVMTHRVDVELINVEDSREEITELIRTTGFSRFPVYEEDQDNIIGVLYVKDFFLNQDTPLRELLKEPIFVPDSMICDDLFRKLQQEHTHFAIVTDEYGSFLGIITMEDLIEEIVGNIYDEYDKKKDYIIPNPDGSWTISGRAELKDVEKVLDIELPEREEFNTLSGLILNETEEIPKEGDQFEITVDGLRIQVLKVVDRRIEETRVSLLPTEPPEEP